MIVLVLHLCFIIKGKLGRCYVPEHARVQVVEGPVHLPAQHLVHLPAQHLVHVPMRTESTVDPLRGGKVRDLNWSVWVSCLDFLLLVKVGQTSKIFWKQFPQILPCVFPACLVGLLG